MNPDEYARLYQVEAHHWWFVGMRRITETLLGPCLDHLERPLRILDAGCGTGGAMLWLGQGGLVWGLDWSAEAIAYCQRRRLPRLCRGSVTALPYPTGAFDLVTCFDVIYHLDVADDVQALRELRRVVRPGGWGLVRVPALPSLISAHDLAVHTRQRYRLSELGAKAEQAGWQIERGTYANTLLLPLAAVVRWARRWAPTAGDGESEVQETPRSVNTVLAAVLSLEAAWLRRATLPLGLSALVLLRAGLAAPDGTDGTRASS